MEQATVALKTLVPMTDAAFWAKYLEHKTLIQKYYKRITAITAPARTGMDRQDNFSDLILKLKDKMVFENYDSEKGGFNGYLYARIQFLCLDRYRRDSLHATRVVPAICVDAEEMSVKVQAIAVKEDTDHSEFLEEATRLLSEDESKVLCLIVDDQLNGSQVAKTLGMNDMRVSRLRKSIKGKLESLRGQLLQEIAHG